MGSWDQAKKLGGLGIYFRSPKKEEFNIPYTPWCGLNAFTFALKDPADAFVLLLMKKFNIDG